MNNDQQKTDHTPIEKATLMAKDRKAFKSEGITMSIVFHPHLRFNVEKADRYIEFSFGWITMAFARRNLLNALNLVILAGGYYATEQLSKIVDELETLKKYTEGKEHTHTTENNDDEPTNFSIN